VTRYFAYGSNMDPTQMAHRCPGAVALGSARLANHELAFVWDSPGWGGGVATVIPSSSREVWGVVWELTDPDARALDRYEGVAVGAYTKDQVEVELGAGTERALIYLATDTRAKDPSAKYIAALVKGAKAFSLPDDYVEKLRALAAR
jgi:gamma-glutamylcyclotransferase (GGCT)/AIG2-like uncharacterized protein YtfP